MGKANMQIQPEIKDVLNSILNFKKAVDELEAAGHKFDDILDWIKQPFGSFSITKSGRMD